MACLKALVQQHPQLVGELLTELGKTIELVRAMNQMSVTHGSETLSPTDELVGLVAYLLDSGAGVSTYTGEPVYAGDGVTAISNPSRLQLLLHAFDKMDVQLASSVPAKEAWDRDLFGAVLAVLSDVIQSRIDCNAGKQLLRWFGEVIEPDDRILFELVELLHYLYEDDSSRIFVELGKNLFWEQRPGLFAINILGRVIKAIHRVDPSARDGYTEQDFEHIVTGLADYLVDGERGLERMYTIISDRN